MGANVHETAQIEISTALRSNLAARDPVFTLTSLTKTYQMREVQVEALRGIDLTLFAGELVVLLGPSGSGKSTLLNIIGGLDVPSSGRVIYRDHDLTEADDDALTSYRREHVGFVFQFYNLVPTKPRQIKRNLQPH